MFGVDVVVWLVKASDYDTAVRCLTLVSLCVVVLSIYVAHCCVSGESGRIAGLIAVAVLVVEVGVVVVA